jgi:hypothetical protein
VGHRIGLHKAWLGDIPEVCANGDLVLQETARSGPSQLP